MLHIIRERMKTFAYVHQTGCTQILGTMLAIHLDDKGEPYEVETHNISWVDDIYTGIFSLRSQ